MPPCAPPVRSAAISLSKVALIQALPSGLSADVLNCRRAEDTMRIMQILLAAVLAWAPLTAIAETGLERFEREIKPQFELEKFSYASAQTLGDTGFVLNDVLAVMPANAATGDKASTLKIDKVTVEALDFDRMKKIDDDDMPRFAKVRLEGMTGDEEMFAALDPYGVPRVP